VVAPVVALVANLPAEGAVAGSAAAGGRGCRWSRFSPLDHLADLHVRVRVRIRVVAEEVHQFRVPGRFVWPEDPGGRACRWLRRLRRGDPFLPLGRWWVGAEPWRWRKVPGPAWRVGWRDRGVDRTLAGGPCVPELELELVVLTFQEGHLVVEQCDVPPEQGDLLVGLAVSTWFGRELVAAERTLLFPELLEAGLACDVAAFHDRGIGVGKRFQADATLGCVCLKGG